MSFEGAIGEIDLIQRLVDLGREQFTGAIRFEQDGIIKIVYFKAGDVLSASTNDRKDAVDEILLRAGKVSREHVKQALAKRKETETLGDALLNLGFITRKELTWARRVQVIGILRSVRSWTTGNYAIVADYLPKREEGTLFPLQQIVVEFMVTEQDRQTFDRAMDGGTAVFRKSVGFDASFEKLGLNEEAAGITAQIDGTHSASEIVNTTGEDAFNVYKLLEALRVLGLIAKVGAEVGMKMKPEEPKKPEPQDELSFESAGVADAADAWNAPAEPPMQFDESDPKVPFALKLDANQMAPPAPQSSEMETGFDDAQIEMAARAAMPHPPMARRPPLSAPTERRSGGLVFVLIVILLLAGIGAAGYMWWQGRQTPPVAPVVARPQPLVPPPAIGTVPATATTPVSGATAASGATTTTATTATTATAIATSTTPPPPAPVQPPVPTPVQTSAASKKKAPTPAASSTAPRLEQTGTGTPMITNIPPGAPRMTPATTRPATATSGGDRYAEMARQYAQNPTGNFTVQFELVCQSASLQKAMDAGAANVWFVPTTYQGKSCYRVFWGHYGTREQAEAAATKIPAALRGGTPVVVPVPK